MPIQNFERMEEKLSDAAAIFELRQDWQSAHQLRYKAFEVFKMKWDFVKGKMKQLMGKTKVRWQSKQEQERTQRESQKEEDEFRGFPGGWRKCIRSSWIRL